MNMFLDYMYSFVTLNFNQVTHFLCLKERLFVLNLQEFHLLLQQRKVNHYSKFRNIIISNIPNLRSRYEDIPSSHSSRIWLRQINLECQAQSLLHRLYNVRYIFRILEFFFCSRIRSLDRNPGVSRAVTILFCSLTTVTSSWGFCLGCGAIKKDKKASWNSRKPLQRIVAHEK